MIKIKHVSSIYGEAKFSKLLCSTLSVLHPFVTNEMRKQCVDALLALENTLQIFGVVYFSVNNEL